MSAHSSARAYFVRGSARIPNSRASLLPVLHYPGVLLDDALATSAGGQVSPDAVEALFEKNGWEPGGRWSEYPIPHHHSTTHEVYGFFDRTTTFLIGADASFHPSQSSGPPKTTRLSRVGEAAAARDGETGACLLLDIKAGDVVVIPSGHSHCSVHPDGRALSISQPDPSAAKMSVTAYPLGSEHWDLVYGEDEEEVEEATARIGDRLARGRKEDWPDDPVWGSAEEAPMARYWVKGV